MNSAIRWRVMLLQAVLAVVVGGAAVLAYAGGTFVQSTVHDQLAAQRIFFPAAGSASLTPAEFPDLQQYAGQQVTDGNQAKAFADGFINRHLQAVAGGLTYAEVSAQSLANPANTGLANQANTLFKGETLRGMLLNAYGWWTVGTYAIYASVALAVATLAVLGALLFEVTVLVRSRRRNTVPAAGHAIRGAAAAH
ncbi:MAG: hypothetical protein ACYDAY_06480 [Candidatus Dormibacteria bacterium]